MPSKLQELIAQQRPGQSLILDPPNQEFEGPILLNRPLVLQGQGATIRARKGPLLTVATTGVQLRNLNLEITGDQRRLSGQEACALLVKPGINLVIKDCFARGDVSGIAGEEGRWIYPRSIRLGKLTPHRIHRFLLRCALPCPCEIICEIDGLTASPKRSSGGGPVHVTLELEPLKPHIRIRGNLVIKTASFSRLITITGNAAAADDVQQVLEGDGQLIFDCEDPKAADRCNAAQAMRPAQQESSADLAAESIVPPPEQPPAEPPSEPLRSPSRATDPSTKTPNSASVVDASESSSAASPQTEADRPKSSRASTPRRAPTRSVPGTGVWSPSSEPTRSAPGTDPRSGLPAEPPLPAADVPEPEIGTEQDTREPGGKKQASPRVKSVPLTNLWSPQARDEQPEAQQQLPAEASPAPSATGVGRAGNQAADNSLDPPAADEKTAPEGRKPPKKPSQRTRISVPASGVFGAAPTPTSTSEPPSAAPSSVAEQSPEPSGNDTAEPIETPASNTPERPKKPKIVKSATVGVFGKTLEDH
jgi:hypothetical protein